MSKVKVPDGIDDGYFSKDNDPEEDKKADEEKFFATGKKGASVSEQRKKDQAAVDKALMGKLNDRALRPAAVAPARSRSPRASGVHGSGRRPPRPRFFAAAAATKKAGLESARRPSRRARRSAGVLAIRESVRARRRRL